MKKVFLIAALAVATMGANAQITFGVQAGANMGNVKAEEDAVDGEPAWESDYDSKFGFLIGGVAEIPVSSNITFRPELNFIQKGFKEEESETFMGETYSYETKTTASFIELPLNFVYNVPAGAGTFFVGLGPSIGFGIGGKMESEVSFAGETESSETDIKFDGDDEATDDNVHLKALDFGGNILAGYKMSNGLFFSLGYTKGFSNLSPYEGTSYKTSGVQLKVGFMFGGAKTNGSDN